MYPGVQVDPVHNSHASGTIGQVGNLADRTARMGVVDWIDLYAGVHHWPAFNIADIGITLGAAVLILNEVFRASANVPPSGKA